MSHATLQRSSGTKNWTIRTIAEPLSLFRLFDRDNFIAFSSLILEQRLQSLETALLSKMAQHLSTIKIRTLQSSHLSYEEAQLHKVMKTGEETADFRPPSRAHFVNANPFFNSSTPTPRQSQIRLLTMTILSLD